MIPQPTRILAGGKPRSRQRVKEPVGEDIRTGDEIYCKAMGDTKTTVTKVESVPETGDTWLSLRDCSGACYRASLDDLIDADAHYERRARGVN